MVQTNRNIWAEIDRVQAKYNSLNLSEQVDYDKFRLYSIIANSTAIEGSTLSELDAQLLFDEGVTKRGTMFEHFMNLDLKRAYEYAVEQAVNKARVTPELLKRLSALVMQNTGSVMNAPGGTFDASEGEYRLCGVTAGLGGRSYMNYLKVPQRVEQLCDALNEQLTDDKSLEGIYNLSFDAHYYLVTIHPWRDGNGRMARLLMNYIQFYYGVVPTMVNKDSRAEYIESLRVGQEDEDVTPFRDFMAQQHLYGLRSAIDAYEKSQERGDRLMFLF